MDFRDYLGRVKTIYISADDEFELSLEQPATDQDLSDLAREIGANLDPDLRAAWSIANGCIEQTPFFVRPGFVTSFDFISTKKAAHARAVLRRISERPVDCEAAPRFDRRIQPGFFHPGWVPFGGSSASMFLIADHAPTPEGSIGQIIAFIHDPDEIVYLSPTLPDFLRDSIDSFEQYRDEILI